MREMDNNAGAPIRSNIREYTIPEILQSQDPYLDAGLDGSYEAGPPFDICNVELSYLATGNEVLNDSSDWLSQYDNAGVHLSQSALQATTDTLPIGKTIGWNKPHVLDPFPIAGFDNSYAASSPFDVCNANPSNLATRSALQYHSTNFMPQSTGVEVHPVQSAVHTASTASTQGELTCSRCGKAFKRKGDLTRHGKSHGLTKFYCLYANCPRHVYANGFHRKDKLVDHLEFSHKMTKEDARHWATSAIVAADSSGSLVDGLSLSVSHIPSLNFGPHY